MIRSSLSVLGRLKQRAKTIRRDTYVVYLACRDPRTPWYAKWFAGGVVAYALSPIDLIPDFIPVLGYVDDLILIPLGIALAVRMIPNDVLADCRVRAQTPSKGPASRRAAAVIITIWVIAASLLIASLYRGVGS